MGKFKNYTYFAVAALLSIAGNAKASDTMENPDSAQDVTVSNVRIERSESFLNCNFTINFADKNLGSKPRIAAKPRNYRQQRHRNRIAGAYCCRTCALHTGPPPRKTIGQPSPYTL